MWHDMHNSKLDIQNCEFRAAAAVFATSVSVSLLKPAIPAAPTPSPFTRIGTPPRSADDIGGGECRSALVNVVLDLRCRPS